MRFLRVWGPSVVIATLLALETRPAEGQTFGTLKEFVEPETFDASLLEGPDGAIYGTTSSGGNFGLGAVFRMTADGTTFSILHSFDGARGALPRAGLVRGPDALYGTTSKGGLWGHGTVFKISADGSGFAVLHAFDGPGGSAPRAALVLGADGAWYGTTYEGGAHGAGTVFRLGAGGASYSTLHSFQRTDGARPLGGVIQGMDGALYGTTSEGGAWSYSLGTIFRLLTDGSSFSVLRSLDYPSGAVPYGGVVQRPSGLLYGTTSNGGAYDGGTVFAISPDGGAFSTVHSFHVFDGTTPQAPLMLAADGTLYGTTCCGGYGSVFKITPADAYVLVRKFDAAAASPVVSLLQPADGSLYGTTLSGGAFDGGTLFRMSGDGSSFLVLQSFSWSEGSRSIGPLVRGPDGDLYGTSTSWGPHGYGAAFRISPDGSEYSVVHGFRAEEGVPTSGLIRGADGALYGATAWCAVDDCARGAIYRLSMDGSEFAVLHGFSRDDTSAGYDPAAAPVLGSDGFLYGTTRSGGQGGGGTIFRVRPDGSSFSVIHHFDYPAGGGGSENGPLLEGREGALYGATAYGGAWDFGTVFRVSTDGSSFTILHEFQGTDGGYPTSGLIQGPDDTLYGVAPGDWGWTPPDGLLRMGTVFALSPDGSQFSLLHAFHGPDGASPVGVLTQGPGGALYGTTWEGGTGAGTVFKILTDGSGFSTLHAFRGEDGRGPWAGLTLGNDGALYGTTVEGGRYGGGVLFRLEDDDGIQFGAPVFTSRGPSSRAVVTVTRKAGLSESMTVDFATSDGSAREGLEYFGSSGTVSFAPGQGTKTLTVQVLPASTYRGDRAFAMALSNPVGAGARLGFQKTAVVSLVDTKPVPKIQFGKATYTGIEGAMAFRVSVLRSGLTDAPVTVDFATGDGSATAPGDYEPVTGTLTFASGVRSGFFTVRLLDDASPEPGESLALTLTNPGGGAILGARATARLNVKDNDQVVQFGAPAYLTSAAASRASVTVRRTGGSAGTITVQYATGSGTAVPGIDYQPVTGTLTFPPGVLARTLAIPVLTGSPSVGTRTVPVLLTGADPPSALGPLSTATLKIQDPNEPLVQFASTSFVTHVATGPRTSSIAVKRLGSLEGTAQVDYATSDGTAVSTVDYLPASGRLTFAPGVASQSVKVTVLPNPKARPDPTVSLALGQVDAPVGTPAAALLKIANGRRSGRVQLAGAAFSGRAAAGIVAIPVTRTEGAAGPAAVEYATSDGTAVGGVDYTPAAGSLHFSSGDTKKWIFVRVSASAPGGKSFFISLGETEGVGLGAMTQAPVWVLP